MSNQYPMTMINKATVSAYVAAMNAGDEAALRAVFAEGAVIVGVTGEGSVDYAMPVWQQLHSGLNMRLEVQSMVAEANVVAVRFIERGSWTGPFLGFTAPTGKAYELVAMEWFELELGKITRRWGVRDSAYQAKQVGFPAAPTKGDVKAA